MSDLRDPIAKAIRLYVDEEWYEDGCTDAVMAVVQPALDANETVRERLHEESEGLAFAWQAAKDWKQRTEQAEATIARVKELALMGGQDPADIRRQIIGVLTQPDDQPKGT